MSCRWLVIPALLLACAVAPAGEAGQVITLAAALKLAGADNLDVLLAHERSFEARARYHEAQQKYLPWLTPGLTYRRTDGQAQTVQGDIITVDKQTYGLGLSLTAEIALGDAIYESLITRRQLAAADHETQVAHQQAFFATRRSYIALVEAQATAHVVDQALQQARDYAEQVQQAQGAGLASAGEVSRATAQVQRRQVQQVGTQADIQLVAARLSEILRLRDGTAVRADDAELQPMLFVNATLPLNTLLTKALAERPELQSIAALQQAAESQRNQVSDASLIPRFVLRGSAGGLGGGRNDDWGNFGSTSEVALGIEWRIGPGGLFDSARQEAAASRTRQVALQLQRVRDRIVREVQESYVMARSASEQIALTLTLVHTTEQGLQLARGRREFGIAAVLEAISADDDLTRARQDYVDAVSRHNQAQAALLYAIGANP